MLPAPKMGSGRLVRFRVLARSTSVTLAKVTSCRWGVPMPTTGDSTIDPVQALVPLNSGASFTGLITTAMVTGAAAT